MDDIRDILFRSVADVQYRAVLTTESAGVLSGVGDAISCGKEIGVRLELHLMEGDSVCAGTCLGELEGTAKQIALAEERLIGTLAKASGIATAARRAVVLAENRVRIVSGSWKKMPPSNKQMIRRAVISGGAAFRICEEPMLYIDKNYIRIFGSISAALAAAAPLRELTRVVQIKGITDSIEAETEQAIAGGAGVLMVDTGKREDLSRCQRSVEKAGARDKVRLAFAGNVELEDIPDLAVCGIDIVCIGKRIIDAPLLDIRLDILASGCGPRI